MSELRHHLTALEFPPLLFRNGRHRRELRRLLEQGQTIQQFGALLGKLSLLGLKLGQFHAASFLSLPSLRGGVNG